MMENALETSHTTFLAIREEYDSIKEELEYIVTQVGLSTFIAAVILKINQMNRVDATRKLESADVCKRLRNIAEDIEQSQKTNDD